MTTHQIQLDPDRSDVDLTCSRTGFTLQRLLPTDQRYPDEYPTDSSTSPARYETIHWPWGQWPWNVYHRVDEIEGIPATGHSIGAPHGVHQPPQNGMLLYYPSTGVEWDMVNRLLAMPGNDGWCRYQHNSSTVEILIWLDPDPTASPIAPGTESIIHRDIYEARIEDLRSIADVDKDIEHVNEESILDFWSFMNSEKFTRRAGLVLQDNGNLRAVWRDEDGHNVGLEFLGDRSILYVIFKPYTDERSTFRKADIATFDAVVNKLRELDMLAFVNV